jgi:2-polyprenyl-6-methoxyphenol hydroxylase-like FAD-dependent oxidoreductase
MATECNVDVLVVGAGPAGLFATNALVKAGINVKVIDKRLEEVSSIFWCLILKGNFQTRESCCRPSRWYPA